MKLPIPKIEAFAAKEASRYTLTGVLLDVENKRLVATNGHMLAVLPVEPEKHDVTGIIPRRAFTLARQSFSRIPKKLRSAFSVNIRKRKNKVLVKNGQTKETTCMDADKGHFPNWEPVLQRHYSGPPTMGLNLHYLADIYEGISNGGKDGIMYLWCDPTDRSKPILVGTSNSQAVAVLMQVRGDRTAESVYGDIVKKAKAEKAGAA